MKKATTLIHAGSWPDEETGAVMPPIYMTSTYAKNDLGYDYTRSDNPNFRRLEELLGAIEEAKYATIFSSGLGALTAMISTLEKGDLVVALGGVYGGTYRLFTKVFNKFGIKFKSISHLEDVEKALLEKPKWLFFETPTNPLLEVYDIKSLSSLAKKQGAKVFVDNTFATPYFQNPLELGADVVWHSTTKYLGGHSDVIGGAVMTNDASFKQELNFARMSLGVNPSPFDAWLTMRGVKTLAVRMEKHQENALKVAHFLEKHPKVKKVYYPGLKSHPQNELANAQMRGFSGIVSAELEITPGPFKLFTLAESLGGVESLVCHPATMTHASIPKEERQKIGISDTLYRFSVGIEDPEDLIADLNTILTV